LMNFGSKSKKEEKSHDIFNVLFICPVKTFLI
jgi:hypothetical protein